MDNNTTIGGENIVLTSEENNQYLSSNELKEIRENFKEKM